jgi:hypothetical protein
METTQPTTAIDDDALIDNLIHETNCIGKSRRCVGVKKTRQTFCPPCYKSLPPDMRAALWQSAGNGYEPAVRKAIAYLAE